MSEILQPIVDSKRQFLKEFGYSGGVNLPEKRPGGRPLPVPSKGFIISEIKRSSPSEGIISEIPKPSDQAAIYVSHGADMISVLTESDFFGGSLQDLIDVKIAHPNVPVLRKDFILETGELDAAYRAGADAVLLIASILSKEDFEQLYFHALNLGLTPLVELHFADDIEKVKDVKPFFTGINSRNLKTFRIDLALPLKIKSLIDWDCTLIFESGIHSYYDAEYAYSAGFDGILTGTSVVRRPELIKEYKQASVVSASSNFGRGSFWSRLYSDFFRKKYLLKICGLTNSEDVKVVQDAGADVAGFVLAESVRKVNTDFLRTLERSDMLKVAVIVNQQVDYSELHELVSDGVIDAVQFHGDETIDDCFTSRFPFYKACRPSSADAVRATLEYAKPRVLLDAFSAKAYGGTGKRINKNIIEEYLLLTGHSKERNRFVADESSFTLLDRSLWLAGGLTPENIGEVLEKYKPELVDISGGLELLPGKKDYIKIEKFVKELNNADL